MIFKKNKYTRQESDKLYMGIMYLSISASSIDFIAAIKTTNLPKLVINSCVRP